MCQATVYLWKLWKSLVDGLPLLPVTSRRLILLLTNLLAITLTRQRFFYTLLFTWFQIKRVTLDFLDDVFGLHLALKATERILKGFTFLYSNLCQEKYTSKHSQLGLLPRIPLPGSDLA
jgi:hypothetical protein